MISGVDKNTVTSILSNILGNYYNLGRDELQFYCPFCHHHKPKLQINLETQKWHCWVCNSGGSRLIYLLNQLDVDEKTKNVIKKIYKGSTSSRKKEEDDTKVFISLPSEYKSLAIQSKGFNPEYLHAIHYLQQRGIGLKEIIKYNIGYCTEGQYARRIIIPSYRQDGSINYFISRSYYPDENMKYKNPPISKNMVCLDSQINWDEEIILCEGVFDAIAIRRNAIPLLGKFPSKELKHKIFEHKIKQITLSLDNDAEREAYRISDYFRKQGITVRLMRIHDKDAADMGYIKFKEELKEAKEFTEEDNLLNKIRGI
jgi:DNA primase